MAEHPRYKIVIEPLSDEDGGGFLTTVPDLPGASCSALLLGLASRRALSLFNGIVM
jgi:hypothetical protein